MLNMVAKGSSKVSLATYKITLHHNPEKNKKFYIHGNLKHSVKKFPLTVTERFTKVFAESHSWTHTKNRRIHARIWHLFFYYLFYHYSPICTRVLRVVLYRKIFRTNCRQVLICTLYNILNEVRNLTHFQRRLHHARPFVTFHISWAEGA
jgi:hypothetical protein